MPIVKNSIYRRPGLLFNRHLETIVPGLFRKVRGLAKPLREKIDTPDGDFLALDWYVNGSKKLVIVSHGLEGDSERPYMLGVVKKFFTNGWDALAWNYRGRSGEMNKTKIFYHSGATYDLDTVVEYAAEKDYDAIALVGFSLGGNLTLKYLGEKGDDVGKIKSATVFSVPLDLAGCSTEIDKPHNFLYSRRFLKSLKKNANDKEKIMPGFFDLTGMDRMKSIWEFDDKLTAPLHGFAGAEDYYLKCSSINFIEKICIPTLVVNAVNDPFLSDSCYNKTPFEQSKNVFFEMPKQGGHVGFSSYNNHGAFWSDQRAFEFISENS